jgi:hypothetical protein
MNKATMTTAMIAAVVALGVLWAANNVDAVGSLTEKKGWF